MRILLNLVLDESRLCVCALTGKALHVLLPRRGMDRPYPGLSHEKDRRIMIRVLFATEPQYV
jgi:hypothetical protein